MSFARLRTLGAGALPALVMFDLDGTLVDSAPDIAAAVDGTLLAHGLPPAGEARVRDWVGRGSRRLLQDAFAAALGSAPPEALLDEALRHYLGAYLEACTARTRPMPGAADLLAALGAAGVPLACVTNKPIAITRRVLQGTALGGFFRTVIGGDSGAGQKPLPGPLLRALEEAGASAARAAMVGDSRHDVEAARAAGVASVAVEGGYNHGECVRAARPDLVVRSLAELL